MHSLCEHSNVAQFLFDVSFDVALSDAHTQIELFPLHDYIDYRKSINGNKVTWVLAAALTANIPMHSKFTLCAFWECSPFAAQFKIVVNTV